MPGHSPLGDGPATPQKPRPAPMRPPSARTTLLRSDPDPDPPQGEEGEGGGGDDDDDDGGDEDEEEEDGDGPVVLDLRTDRTTPLQTACAQARLSATTRHALMMTLALGMCGTTAPVLGLEMGQDHEPDEGTLPFRLAGDTFTFATRPLPQLVSVLPRPSVAPPRRKKNKPKVERNRRRARAAAQSRARNR